MASDPPRSHEGPSEEEFKAVNTAISSPWAIFVAATVALFPFFFGDQVGLDRQRVDLTFS